MPLVKVVHTLFLLRAKISIFSLFHVNHMAAFQNAGGMSRTQQLFE